MVTLVVESQVPIRAVAYVRVSQAREGMVSPELQMRAIAEYCDRRGYVIAETLQDLDLSGRFWRLRQVERAIAMVEADEADVIVVWRWSRVSRNRLDWALAVDRVEAAGGQLESATEGFDTATSTGRLARGLLAELAAFESERTGDVWREIKDRRASRGMTPNGHVQFGYRKRPDGTYIPDRKTGPIVAELYRRYVDGAGHFPLARWLNEQKIRTPRTKNTWGMQQLAQSMDNGFAAGHVKNRGQVLVGSHQPLIDEQLWQAYLTARASRRQVSDPRDGKHLLTGLLWCGCGCQMSANRRTGTYARAQYMCHGHPKTLSGSVISRQRCEAMVRLWLIQVATDGPLAAGLDDAVKAWVGEQAGRADQLRARVVQAPEEDRAGLLGELEELRAAAGMPAPTEVARALVEDWEVATPAAINTRLRGVVTRVEVFADRQEPLLQFHTPWGTVMALVGWKAQARPAEVPLPGRHESQVSKGPGPLKTVPDAVDPLQLLTPAEASRVAGVGTQTLRNWHRAGRLPHTQESLGRGMLYAVQDLRAARPRRRNRAGSAAAESRGLDATQG